MAKPVELEINGKRYPVNYPSDTPLLYVLRDETGLTGNKYGCGEGQCGTCTVLIGGAPHRSCQIHVSAVAAKPITTIEGLEKDGRLILEVVGLRVRPTNHTSIRVVEPKLRGTSNANFRI